APGSHAGPRAEPRALLRLLPRDAGGGAGSGGRRRGDAAAPTVSPGPPAGDPAMCGFAGFLTTAAVPNAALAEQARRMIAPIRHRGPDDSGTWTDEAAGVALGFRRLAIIDLSANGHQPMWSASHRF